MARLFQGALEVSFQTLISEQKLACDSSIQVLTRLTANLVGDKPCIHANPAKTLDASVLSEVRWIQIHSRTPNASRASTDAESHSIYDEKFVL